MQWAREHGCPWDEMTCVFATLGGHLAVLQWAREHNCPWDWQTCITYSVLLSSQRHMEILKWAREHGAPWDAATRDLAAKKGYTDNLPLSL